VNVINGVINMVDIDYVQKFEICKDLKNIRYQLLFNGDILLSFQPLADYMFNSDDPGARRMDKNKIMDTLDKFVKLNNDGLEVINKIDERLCPYSYLFEARGFKGGFYVKR